MDYSVFADQINAAQLAAPKDKFLIVQMSGRVEEVEDSAFYRDLGQTITAQLSPRLLLASHGAMVALWYVGGESKSHLFCEGVYQRAAAMCASAATYFSALAGAPLPFDASVWHVNNVQEAAKAFEIAEHNAFNRSLYIAVTQRGGRIKKGLGAKVYLDWLHDHRSHSFEDQEVWLQHGSYFSKYTMKLPLTEKQLASMPEHIRAASTDKLFDRSVIIQPFTGLRRREDASNKQLLADLLLGRAMFTTDHIVQNEIERGNFI